jgi:hypothetical protein
MDDSPRSEEVKAHCERLEYPVMRADAAATLADVTVDVADGETNLGVVVSELDHDSFTGPDELYDAVASSVDDSPLRGA